MEFSFALSKILCVHVVMRSISYLQSGISMGQKQSGCAQISRADLDYLMKHTTLTKKEIKV